MIRFRDSANMKEVKSAILSTLLVVAYTQEIEDIGIDECRNEGYFDIIVSFWRKNPHTGDSMMLGIGALIGSNLAFATVECAHLLHPYKEIGVQTGTMKMKDIHPYLILARTQKLPSKSRFALVILNEHFHLSSIYSLNSVDESDYGDYDAVILGWQHEEGLKAKPINVKIGRTLSLNPTNYNYSYADFPPGSVIVDKKKLILGFTHYSVCETMVFYKILLQDMISLKKYFRGQLRSNIEPEQASEKEEVQISDETYLNTIVAFFNARSEILCIGALIKPDCVMTINTCYRKLKPYTDIGLLTANSYLNRNFTYTTLNYASLVHGYSKCHLVYLSESIKLPQSLEVDWMKMLDHVSNGVIAGWTDQRGPVVIRNILYDYQYQIRLRSHGGLCINETLLIGSFIAKGVSIIGFVGTAGTKEITFNKVTQIDQKFLIAKSNKRNRAPRKLELISGDFPPTKRPEH